MIDTEAFNASVAVAIDAFREFSREAETNLDKALVVSALAVEGDAKKLAPVDTGRLGASITHRLGDGFAEVGLNTEYAPYQEFGTSNMPAHPFLTPAFEGNKEKIKTYLANAIKKAAENAGR